MANGRACRFCGEPIEELQLSAECAACRVTMFVAQQAAERAEQLDQHIIRAIEDGHDPMIVMRYGEAPYVADAAAPGTPLYSPP